MTSTLAGPVYEVANLGARPHNLSPCNVDAAVVRATGELAILVLKPDFYPNHPTDGLPLQRYTEGLLTGAGLDVLCTAERQLSSLEVCELYRNVLPSDPEDDAQWGTAWKRSLIAYMSGGELFSYLLEGDDAFRKSHLIKNFMRARYAVDPNTQVVQNVGHVPDPPDFHISLDILFRGGLAADNLNESKAF